MIALEAKEFKVAPPQDEFRDLGLRPDSGWSRLWQTLIAGLGLLILLPVSLAIAVATKLTSRGPVIYKGTRIGRNMVVKFPGASHPKGRLDDLVQNLDVTPTVLREAGVPVPADMQGQPLREVKRPTIAEEDINPFLVADYGDVYNRAIRVVVDGPWKLISTSKGQRMLFDLSKDPQEKNDLAAAEPERVQELAQRLESTVNTKLAAAPATGRVD